MRLPNGNHANLGDKLERYSLNSLHRFGRHKARVFASALGITLDDVELLRAALLRAAIDSDDVVSRGDRGYGETFELRFRLQTSLGGAIVASGWIIDHGSNFHG